MGSKTKPWLGVAWAVAFAALVLNTVAASINVNTMILNDTLVTESYTLRRQLVECLSYLKDAETGQRGYILVGREGYLKPYTDALDSLDAQLDKLKKAYRPPSEQGVQLEQLERLMAARQGELKMTIELRKVKGFDAALEVLKTDVGKTQMDAIRAFLNQMVDDEAERLDERVGTMRAKYRTTIVTGLFGGGLTLAMTLVAFGLVRREAAWRLRAEDELRAQARDLETSQRRQAEWLEREVRERTAALDAANAELRRSNQELEQFAYVASHDLQEPLRKILAFGDRLQQKFTSEVGEQGVDYLMRIVTSAARMRQLIDDLLTFSRVSTREQKFESVNLTEIANLVVADLEVRIQQTEAVIDLGPLPALRADALQMRQLLQNLIANGLKFHKPGMAPKVRIRADDIQEESPDGPARRWCRLTVADDGIGFDEKYLDRIFQIFQRLHGRQDYEGTGIGLAICRKIAERHGGTITAHSQPGEGATFIVTLPLRADGA